MNVILFQALLAVGAGVLFAAGVAIIVLMARLVCDALLGLRASLRDLKLQHELHRKAAKWKDR